MHLAPCAGFGGGGYGAQLVVVDVTRANAEQRLMLVDSRASRNRTRPPSSEAEDAVFG
jgi:hypothetical protein